MQKLTNSFRKNVKNNKIIIENLGKTLLTNSKSVYNVNKMNIIFNMVKRVENKKGVIKMNKDVLIQNLAKVIIDNVKDNKDVTKEIKQYFREYEISGGMVQKWVNNPEAELREIGEYELFFMTDAVYEKTRDISIVPTDYYSEREIKELKTTYEPDSIDKIKLPYTFENVIKIDEDDYIMSITGETIKKIRNNQSIFQYNEKTQREASLRTVKDKEGNDTIVPVPKLNEKNVKEMVELIKKGKLIKSMITFNARLGTSDSGEELIYDEDNKTLTITDGTYLDVLDGYHRINAVIRAMVSDPSLGDTVFKLNIVNFGQKQAQEYFAQLNTMTPVSTGRIKEMKESRQADFIAKQIQHNSDLGEYMTSSNIASTTSKLLVTFNMLSDSIDEVFDIQDKPTAMKTAKYLSNFFDEMMLNVSEPFMTDIVEWKRKSIINTNSMFMGYIVLAKRFKDEDIPVENIENVLNSIDFSRDNKMWQDLGVTDSNGYIKSNATKNIKKYFEELELKTLV